MNNTNSLPRNVQEATTRRRQAGERRTRLAGRNRLRPDLLALEERRMLSMVITVISTSDSGPNTLREAVATANAATQPVEIKFDLPAAATITLTSAELELTNTAEPIAIEGPGANDLTVDGNNTFRVFEIDNGVTASISGLSVSGGFTTYGYGAGILNQGESTLTGATVSHNATPFATFSPTGGGLVNFGMATVVDSTFANNIGGQGGGVVNGGPRTLPSGTATLEGCSFIDNTSLTFGGGMENFGSATLDRCSFVGNSSPDDGGGFGATGGGHVISSVLSNCSFIDNTSGSSGGGLAVDGGGSGPLQVVDCIFRNNQATGGGGLILNGGLSFLGGGPTPATISGCVIEGNRAIFPIQYEGGVGGAAGGLGVNGIAATVTDCIISNNYTNGQSGGMEASGAPLSMTGVTISGNSATSEGGGLILAGPSTLTDCTISGNSAGQGGGLWLFGGANVALVACTISGNSATTAGGGGGLYSYPYYGTEPSVTLTDTIVAGNTASDGASDFAADFLGAVTGSYNLIGTGGSGGLTAANHNILDVADTGLAPLGDYGGPTETMALQPNSPAIHAGVAVAGVTTDQRGFPLAHPVDIGAFQSQADPLVVDTAIDGIGSSLGQLSLRQAVNLANVLDGGDAITFDKSVFKKAKMITLTDGPLEISNTTGPISITGTTAKKLTISGGGTSGVFQVDAGASATLSNLTITGGVTTGNGGGLLNEGTTTLSNIVVAGDVASGAGGGIDNEGSLFASNLTAAGNLADNGGGIANSGTAVILASSIDGNVATADGGGIFNTGELMLILSDLSANSAALDGGGLFNSGTATLVFGTVDDNSASAGGGVYADPSGQPVVMIGTDVTRNKGGNIFGRVINI